MDANHTQRNPKKEEEEEQRQERCAMKAPPDHYVCQKTAFLFEETSPTEECNDNEPIHKTEGHGFGLDSFNEFTGYKSKDTEASSVSASYIASLELSENAETSRLRGAKEEGGEYEDRFQHEDAVVTLQKHEKGGTVTASTDTEVAIAEYSMLKHKGEDEKDGTELRDSLHEQSAIEDTALDLESTEDSSLEANIRADANFAAELQRKLAQDEDSELELNRKEMNYIETEVQLDAEFAAALQKQLETEDAALRSEESNEPCHDIEADTHFSVALQEMLEEEDDRQRRELGEKDAFMAVAMENGFLPGKDLVAEADAVYAAKLERQLTMEAEKFREESRRADAEYAALLERELMIEAQKREEESRKADEEYAAQLETKLAAEDEIWGKEEPEDDAEYAAQLEQKLAVEAEKFKEETRESDAAYAVQLERQLTVEIKKREEESVKVDAEYAAQLERQLTAELQQCEEETRKADADFAVELEQKFKAEERQRNEERCRADAEYAAEVESRLKQELEKRDEESRRADAEYAAELEKEVTDEIKKRKEESRQADAEYAAALERELAEEVEKRREESRRADAEFAAQLERELKEEVEKRKESCGEDAEYAAKLERELAEEVEKRKAESRRADEEYAAQLELELTEEIEKRKEESRKADAEYAAELEHDMVEEVEKRKEESRRADAEYAVQVERELVEEAEKLKNESRMMEELGMGATHSGNAWNFVRSVQEVYRTKIFDLLHSVTVPDAHDSHNIVPIAIDEMHELAENMLTKKEEFQQMGKSLSVDIGYHYSRAENLNNIRENGLLTHAERSSRNIVTNFNGSMYGDGIYTANNPFAFHGHYGDVGILVARLKGNVETVTAPVHRWNDGIDSKLRVATNGQEEIVVLKSSSQCVPLVKFAASLVDKYNSTSVGNNAIYLAHRALQEVVDRFFNNGNTTDVIRAPPRIRNDVVPLRASRLRLLF